MKGRRRVLADRGPSAAQPCVHPEDQILISVGSINQSPIQIHAKRTVALAAGRANSAEYGARVIPAAKLTNMDIANVDTAAKDIAENADIAFGAKVRMSKNVIAKNALEPLRQ